jgi:hypothetical protein
VVGHRRDAGDGDPAEAAAGSDAGHVLEDGGMLNESRVRNNIRAQQIYF